MILDLSVFISRHFRAFCVLGFAVVAVERIGSMIEFPERLYSGREWSTTFYLANYADYGFLKRGVLGTILRPLLQSVDDPRLWVLGIMVAVTLCFLVFLVLIADRFFSHTEVRAAHATHLIRTAIAIGSAGIPQITNEHGSLDHYGLLLMLLALVCVINRRVIVAALLCPFAILLHEAFAVYALPLVMAVSFSLANGSTLWDRLRAPLFTALCAAPAMLAVLVWGNNPAAAMIPYGVGQRVWQRDLIEVSSSYSISQIIAVCWYWAAILTLICSVYRADRSPSYPIYLAMLSPLLLNVLGVDHARWVGLGFFVALTGIAILVRYRGVTLPVLTRPQLLCGGILCLPLGPLSQVHPLPWLL